MIEGFGMNRIDKEMYKVHFEELFNSQSDEIRMNRYLTAQEIRLPMDNWCRKTFSQKYDSVKERTVFKDHMTQRFNETLDEVFGT